MVPHTTIDFTSFDNVAPLITFQTMLTDHCAPPAGLSSPGSSTPSSSIQGDDELNELIWSCEPCGVGNDDQAGDALFDKTPRIKCSKFAKKRNQKVCEACRALLRTAFRHAKRMGEEHLEACKAITKAGGVLLNEALCDFETKCLSFAKGSRPPYDWLQYNGRLQYASDLRAGVRLVWLTKLYFAENQRIHNGLSSDQSDLVFQQLLATLPPARINAAGEQILYQDFRYVDASVRRSQDEDLEYGHLQVRNPGPGDVAQRQAWPGRDMRSESAHANHAVRPNALFRNKSEP